MLGVSGLLQMHSQRFKEACEKNGITCTLIPLPRKDGLKAFYSRQVKIGDVLVLIRKLQLKTKYYAFHGLRESMARFVVFEIPDDPGHWLILPISKAERTTMFSLYPDLDRETLSFHHDWKNYLDNFRQLSDTHANEGIESPNWRRI